MLQMAMFQGVFFVVQDLREYCEYCEDEREKKNKWWQINKGYLENKVHSLERNVADVKSLKDAFEKERYFNQMVNQLTKALQKSEPRIN